MSVPDHGPSGTVDTLLTFDIAAGTPTSRSSTISAQSASTIPTPIAAMRASIYASSSRFAPVP